MMYDKPRKIVIYSKPNCGYCISAKNMCESKGINYEYLMLDEDYTFEKFQEEFPNARTFPQIVVDDRKVGGFNELQQVIGGG